MTTKKQPEKRTDNLRRLARGAMYGLIRGAATATGSAIMAFILWWITNR